MLGLAMILQAAIFLAAAIFRKKFLNLIMESVQEGASRYHEKVSERIIQANAAIARRLGLADMISDWWIARHNRGRGGDPPDDDHKDAALGGVWEQMPPPPSRPSNAKQLPPGGPVTIDIEPEPEVWEGRPPQGYPFKELGNGHEETGFILVNKENAHDTSLNTAGAIPKGIINSRQANGKAAMKKEAAAAADGAATLAGEGVTTAAVNMAVTAGKKVKEGVQGEARAVAGPAISQPAGGVRLEGGRETGNLLPATGSKATAQNQGQTWSPAKQTPEPVNLNSRPIVNQEALLEPREPRRPEAMVDGTANTTGTQDKPQIPAQPGPPAG
ncbi:hypothetical protein E308F_10330 [Moorella sp. E308F]|uniref:hypothetical protein n=1 Tax=Moorella sp. E308F TaxID=2572682 RepID=UPI0010FFAC8E|nr:hypothetical protein [Moorella sp. E308F]GEA14791.1 hypothetical protein E308F_10330 [Moorella sp. E308F]